MYGSPYANPYPDPYADAYGTVGMAVASDAAATQTAASPDANCSGSGVVFGPSSCGGCCTGYNGGADEVQAIQIYLQTLGYMSSGTATGRYGTQTYQAVLKFQSDYGLSSDGRVGEDTLRVLMEQAQRRRTEAAATAPTSPSTAQPTVLETEHIADTRIGSVQPKLTDRAWFWPVLALSVVALAGGVIWWRRS